ncbi:hypothetical protein CLU79DRAFT_691178, partial [Phycomyces nitens]
EGLKALADSATSSRRILTLTNALADQSSNALADQSSNALADESSNASINDTTSSPPSDNTTSPLVDDTIDVNDGFLFPGTDNTFSVDHQDFQLHRLTYKKV